MVQRFAPYVFAASGVVQLPDGRVLVVEDTKRHPLVLVDLFGRGTAKEFAPRELASATGRRWISDLEAATIDDRGRVYAITSHSLDAGGEARDERELLVRFEVQGDTVANARVAAGLKASLAALHPVLARGADKRPKRKGTGLNIEGLARDPTRDRLLLGFRSPLIGGSAIIVSLDNPTAVLEQSATPRLSGPFLLALDGAGIRDLTWDATLGGYLVVAGAARRSSRRAASLWLWRGDASPPVLLDVPAIDTLKPEGIALVTVGVHRARAVLLVCDDGHVADARSLPASVADGDVPSRYVLIPYDTLLPRNAARLGKDRRAGADSGRRPN